MIHTVGPIWQGGKYGEAEKLIACYRNSLRLALEYHLATVAFPAISTGVYGYPKEEAAALAIDTIFDFISEYPQFHRIYLVAFDSETENIYRKKLAALEEA